jgi:CHAT domain-containing protein
VVVLLVCSGGRIDRDPLSFTALGLPYELLDRGCRAVVASPWPIEPTKANLWMPWFLDSWDAGRTVAEAVHDANLKLRAYAPMEAHFLAMHVFGNPLERADAPAAR